MEQEKLDVPRLIGEWQMVRDLMAPSPELFQGHPEGDLRMAELSLMSSRRRNWTAYVGLMGYAQETKVYPARVLDSIHNTIRGEYAAEADGFLQYCSAVANVSREMIVPATYSIKLIQGDRPLVNTPKHMSILDYCLRLHPDDPAAVLRCLKGK